MINTHHQIGHNFEETTNNSVQALKNIKINQIEIILIEKVFELRHTV